MQRQIRSVHTEQACGDFTVAAFEQVVDVPVVVRHGSGLDAQIPVEVPQLQFLAKVDVLVQRQVLWSKQCRTLFGSPQLQLLDKVIDVPFIFNDTCPWRSGQCKCSSWTRLLTCALCQRHVPMAVQPVQFLDKNADVPSVVHDRCLWRSRQTSSAHVLSCMLLRTTGRCLRFSFSPEFEDMEKCALCMLSF